MTPNDADRLVNLTGHPLRIFESGQVVKTVPPDGPPFRLVHTEHPGDRIAGVEAVPVEVALGPLPPLVPGTWIVVSQVAAFGLAAAGVRRPDILFPGPGVADRGRQVGCRGLRWIVH